MQVVGSKKTILVVEDEELLGDILQEELELNHLAILRSSGGKAAVEILKSQFVDLVITDVRMAHGDGRYVLAEINKLPGAKPLTIVLTGFSDLSESEAKALGVYAFIHKPFDIEAVVQSVKEALGIQPTASSQQPHEPSEQ